MAYLPGLDPLVGAPLMPQLLQRGLLRQPWIMDRIWTSAVGANWVITDPGRAQL